MQPLLPSPNETLNCFGGREDGTIKQVERGMGLLAPWRVGAGIVGARIVGKRERWLRDRGRLFDGWMDGWMDG